MLAAAAHMISGSSIAITIGELIGALRTCICSVSAPMPSFVRMVSRRSSAASVSSGLSVSVRSSSSSVAA